jgi:endoglucanase
MLVDGRRVGEFTGVDTQLWRNLTVPVWLDGPTVAVGATPVAPKPGKVVSPIHLDWMSLTSSDPEATVSGNRVLDVNGRATIVRGVNRAGLEQSALGDHLSDKDFGGMASWGVGIVRLQLAHRFWLADSCDYDPGYVDRVDAAVESITSRGMVALIDLHRTTKNQACNTDGDSATRLSDELGVTFWSQVAARYADNPLVAFDLFNEPHDVTPAEWRNGGWIAEQGWQGIGMQQLYDTVRATGAQNLIFVSGIGWAYDVSPLLTNPLNGYGIVAASHVYCPICEPGTVRAGVDTVLLPVAAQYPVVITEFGAQRTDGAYHAALIDWAEAHGIGWAAFTWAAIRPEYFGLIKSWDTMAPNAAGSVVRNALQAAAADA